MIKLIVFDFSGTLAYSEQEDLKGFFGPLLEFGIKITQEKEAEYLFDFFPSFFSKADSWNGFAIMMAAEFSITLSKERKDELAKYLEKKLSFKLYDDAKEISALPQRKAILTLASRFLVESIDDLAQFDIFTSREIRYAKPDKRAFLEVLKKMKTVPSEAIMIGDSFEKDIEPALALGMKGVLIDREGKVSDNSIVKISSLKDLKQYL